MMYTLLFFNYVFSLAIQSTALPTINPQPAQDRVYVITKGEHRSQGGFSFVSGTKFRFKAAFDSSAVYQTAQPIHQADVNKLYGFSDCYSQHHSNSARFGWRWLGGKLEIMAYCYQNGERQSEVMGSVALNKSYEYEIEIREDAYVFRLNGVEKKMLRGCSGRVFGYKLYPYFGGQEVAPHDISIKIQDL